MAPSAPPSDPACWPGTTELGLPEPPLTAARQLAPLLAPSRQSTVLVLVQEPAQAREPATEPRQAPVRVRALAPAWEPERALVRAQGSVPERAEAPPVPARGPVPLVHPPQRADPAVLVRRLLVMVTACPGRPKPFPSMHPVAATLPPQPPQQSPTGDVMRSRVSPSSHCWLSRWRDSATTIHSPPH